MKLIYLILFVSLITTTEATAQIGGESTYEFLNLVNSARMAALGGNQIAINDSTDLNVAYNNPALLAPTMHNKLLMNYVAYFSGINYGYAAFAHNLKEKGTLGVGVHYINYGEFIQASATGQKEGTFTAAEYSLNLNWAKRYGRWQVGATLKPILSSFESYQSVGLAADLGLNYASRDQLTNYALVIRNIGAQLTTYYENGQRESLPFDLQLGFSKRLAHAPLRLSATLQHLQRWNLSQPDENETATKTISEEEGFGKLFLRHLLLGVELLASENFTVRAGYNYQRRQELMFDDKASTVGFSWGFGFKINRFHFDYGSARYHLAASSNHISVAIRLGTGY
ncbi:type IX secretion system protein PorQ [Gaoshiqia sediminis]|uniref:Type IX secretion system protein PorQ n=1 Tax=Gaoshiqia sediminis TaxID=2986998 RepID=A0AA41YC09_9BACT|nr:type IX secretion system protein PorQ [Gaoshiqia sediminis]MCW0483415.1 type IX secretion system protein PorQ [Gaoshiqia sediminis]